MSQQVGAVLVTELQDRLNRHVVENDRKIQAALEAQAQLKSHLKSLHTSLDALLAVPALRLSPEQSSCIGRVSSKMRVLSTKLAVVQQRMRAIQDKVGAASSEAADAVAAAAQPTH